MIYLDNAATTYPKPESVYEKMDWANRNLAFNAGRGSYSLAKEASRLIDETRELLLNLVHGNGTEKVVLTTSATEALNIILQGIPWHEGDVVYVSPFEHNAVARTLELVKEHKGIRIELLPVTEETLEIDIEKTKYLLLKDKPKCVCCTHVSNVTGYILPVDKIFDFAHSLGAITVLDSSQSLGLVDIDVKAINADFIAFAGHKTLYGPFGVGGFIDINQINLNLVFAGGTGSDSLNLNMPTKTPDRYEAASKNIVAIAGLNAALQSAEVKEAFKHENELLNYMIDGLQKIKGVTIYQEELKCDQRTGVLSFNVKGMLAEDIGIILSDDFDIAVRVGYHCAPYIHRFLNDEKHLGTVRVGLSKYNSFDEVETLLKALKSI